MYASVWIILWVPLIQASHFRGALFSWSPNSDGSIDVDFRMSWRRSSSGSYCNTSIISNNIIVGDTGDIECYDGCTGILGSVKFYCTDYSVEQDWTTGRNTIKYTPTTTMFSFGFSGGNWISLNGAGGGSSWSFKATVDLRPRSDTGNPNTSPTVDMAPVVKLMHGCQHTIIIPVSDTDGDVVRCRWASGIEECADVCMSFSGSSLDESQCTLTYSANDATGYYAVALQIEDFLDETSNTPLSSIPIQFLVYVFEMSGSACSEKPKFVQPTPQEGSCYNVMIGEIMHVTLKASGGQRLRSITTISAVGMQRSSEIKSQDSSAFYISVNVTWAPSEHDAGKDHSLCFYASDENGLVSDTRCMHVPVSAGRPKITNITRKGLSNTWDLKFDQKYLIPTASAVLEVFERDTGNKVHDIDVYNSAEVDFDPENKSMSITFNFKFQHTTKYYVLIPEGMVGRKTSCGSLSEPVVDDTFWEIENRIDCGCPRNITNGTINATNGIFYPSVITYQCDEGFSLWGERTRRCLESGVWSGCDPVCRNDASVMDFFVNSVRIAYNSMQSRKP